MRSTALGILGLGGFIPATKMAGPLARPPNSTQQPTSAPRALAAERHIRWADFSPFLVVRRARDSVAV